MHYPYNAFAKNPRKRTVVPLKPNDDKPYKRISHLDVMQANMMYRCNDKKQTINRKQENFKKEKERTIKETPTNRNVGDDRKTQTDNNENVEGNLPLFRICTV